MSIESQFSRRRFLQSSSVGFGAMALTNLIHQDLLGAAKPKARAKNVILCYMSGGISHLDSLRSETDS